MNILMVNREMDIGGGNTFLRNIAPALRERGHRCYLVSGPGQTLAQQQAAFDEVIVRPLVMPWDAWWLAGLIRRLGIDIVNAHALVQLPAVTKACARTRTPLVLTLPAPFAAKRVARFLPAADGVMVMNEYQRRHFAKMGVPDDRMFRPYWLMDWDAYARKARPFAERKYDAVYCSRLSSTKGPLGVAFLQALAALLPQRPDMRVAIVGGGRHMPQVRAAADRLNAAARREAVDILTDVLDSAPIFADSRVVAGGNYVCIEAMAAGAFAIGTGYDGVFGLVTPDNLEEAAEQYFADHMTPNTGVERDDNLLVEHFTAALTTAFDPASQSWLPALHDRARPLFRREDGAAQVEAEFQKAIARRH